MNKRWKKLTRVILTAVFIGLSFILGMAWGAHRKNQLISYVESFPGGQVNYEQKRFRFLPREFTFNTHNIQHISLHNWDKDQGSLSQLGKYDKIFSATLFSPENISAESSRFLLSQPSLQSLEISGEDSFEVVLQNLAQSHIQVLCIFDHKLTVKEAELLVKSPSLKLVRLMNTIVSPEATKILYDAGIQNVIYTFPKKPLNESEIDNIREFLKNYGPVDQIHWNDQSDGYYDKGIDIAIPERTLSIDLPPTPELELSLDKYLNMSDTSRLQSLTISQMTPTNLETLLPQSKLTSLKKLSIYNAPKPYQLTEYFMELKNLEELSCREGQIEIDLLDKLLQHPKLKFIEFSLEMADKQTTADPSVFQYEEDIKHAKDERTMIELIKLGTKHHWHPKKLAYIPSVSNASLQNQPTEKVIYAQTHHR